MRIVPFLRRGCVYSLAVVVGGLAVSGVGCSGPQEALPAPPPPKVTVSQPVIRTIEDTLFFTGQTVPIETVQLRARVRGFIQSREVEGGRRVNKGDLLFIIDPGPFDAVARQATAQVASSDAQLRLTEITLQQRQQTFDRGASTRFELDQAIAQRDDAKSQLELARARLREAELNLDYTKVVAPISGRLNITLPEPGELVDVGQLLATLVNDSKIYARYNVSENTMLRLRAANQNRRPGEDGRPVHVVQMGLGDGVDYPITGEFYRGENVVDSGTATIQVEALFDNPDGRIVPGLTARLRAIMGNVESMLIPNVAVMLDQQGRYVFVVNDKNIVERRNVSVSQTVVDGMRVITDGLQTSDRVIINGLQRARPAAPVDPEMQKIE
jgi:RND family efflux transporter MFP subunit